MTNKYLKYHPYITREIFEDMIKCLNKEYKIKFNTYIAYNIFSTKLKYLVLSTHNELQLAYEVPSYLKPASWIKILGTEYILKLANEHYPLGTKYHHLKSQTPCQVGHEFICYPNEDYITDGRGGWVYGKGVWADKIEQGTTVSHPECPALITFPETGLCIDNLGNLYSLVQYLNDRPTRKVDKLLAIPKETIGIAWNEASCCIIKEKSSKPNYSFSQLEKFIKPAKEFIVNSWYKCDNNVYLKFKYKNNKGKYNELHGEVIKQDTYIVHDYIANLQMEIYALDHLLLDLSSIQRYLPDGHIDKINIPTPKIIIENGKFVGFEEQNSSDSKFKLYDWVMINESELPIRDNWLGEGGNITHQGAYQITEIENNHVKRLGNIKCVLGFRRFRLATQDEINVAIRRSKHEHYVNKFKQVSNMLSNKHKEDNYIFGLNEDFKINIDSFDNPNQIHVPKKATIKVEVNQEVKINIPVKSKIKI